MQENKQFSTNMEERISYERPAILELSCACCVLRGESPWDDVPEDQYSLQTPEDSGATGLGEE